MSNKLVILGNRATCSKCRKLYGVTEKMTAGEKAARVQSTLAAIRAALPGVDVVDADKTDAPSLYNQFRPATTFSFPTVRVYAENVLIGSFVASGYTPARIAAKVSALCPQCADGAAQPPARPAYRACPNCNGKKRAACPTCGKTGTCLACNGSGKILALLVAILSIGAAGCITQKVTIMPPQEPIMGTNQVASVCIAKTGTNVSYRATGGVLITMGIYSTKRVDPETTATIPLK